MLLHKLLSNLFKTNFGSLWKNGPIDWTQILNHFSTSEKAEREGGGVAAWMSGWVCPRLKRDNNQMTFLLVNDDDVVRFEISQV